jgi:uncharacterized repeat protein (TIGR02543 family)
MKYLGMDPVYQPAKFYVDDKLVANVNYNVEEMKFVESEIPADPVKDGYVFQGWYFTDDLGDECEFDVTSSIHKKVNAGTYIPLDVYAKFVPKNEYNNDVALTFNSDTYYVPLVSADGFKYTNYFDLKDYLGIYPYGINAKKIKWSYGPDEKHLTKLDESDSLSLEQEGTYILVADYKGNKAKAKIIVVNEEDTYLPTDFKVKDSVKVSVNGANNVGISFKKNDKKPSVNFYNHMSYKSEDYEIADVNDQGIVLGKKPGKTRIYSFLTNEDETVIVRSTEVIVGAALPDNAGIKSVKKSGKKLKVTLTKAQGAKGYQVAVYKTEANAKANKKALLKKYVTKTSFTLKSAKFKKCKKLYLKVRAYNMDGKTKQYSEWSDIKS